MARAVPAVIALVGALVAMGCQSATCDEALIAVDGSCRDWTDTSLIGRDARAPSDVSAASPVASVPSAPQAALEAGGEGLAIWTENGASLWASRFVPADGWQEPLAISEGEFIDEASVALDPLGEALAVWREKPRLDVAVGIWSSSFSPEGDWLFPQPIHLEPAALTQQVGSPSVAKDNSGGGVAVWSQRDDPSGKAQIWSNTYSPVGGWESARLVHPTAGAQEQFRPRMVLDQAGNGFVVWIQYEPTAAKPYTTWASRYTSGGGWGEPERLDSSGFGSFINSLRGVQLGADRGGHVLAVWGEQLANQQAIAVVANRFEVGRGWTGPERLGTEADASSTPRLSVSPNGNAVAVWRERRQPESIWASYYSKDDGWGEADRIGLHTAPFDTLSFDVMLSAAGSAIAAWAEPVGGTDGPDDEVQASIWVASFSEADGWLAPRRLEPVLKPSALSSPSVGLDANGNAVVVWQQADEGGSYVATSRLE